MLSERKIMVRAGLEILVEAMEPYDFCLYSPQQLPEDIQLLQREYPMMLPKEIGEKSFNLDEDMEAPSAEKLLYSMVEPKITKRQVVGDKLSMVGVARCHFLYDMGSGALQPQDVEIEFSQLADLDHEYDKEAEASVVVAVSSLEAELLDGRIRLKCGMVGQYLISDNHNLELVEDAYSPIRTIVRKEDGIQLPAMLDRSEHNMRAETVMNIPCTEVVDTVLFADCPVVHQSSNMAELEVKGNVQVLYRDLSGLLQCSSGKWNKQLQLPADSTVNITGQVISTGISEVTCAEGQLQLTHQIEMIVESISGGEINMVSGLDLGEVVPADPARPSLVMCRKGEQSLWDLAKNNGSTVEAIKRANNIKEEPMSDRMLLIPVS
jgi:hypothetical protein